MKASIWVTDREGKRLSATGSIEMPYVNADIQEEYAKPNDIEAHLVNVHDDVTYQTVGGFGGAITDTSATAWQRLSPARQAEVIRAYYDRENGIGYTLGRLSIASCDFSTEDYTYVREGDETLDSFDLSHDERAVFPMVRAAEAYGPLTLLASPWSPPAYMKTNGSRIYGGKLKREYYPLWAKYMRRYVDECRARGINIWAVTMQNEPRHTQMWESCLYTPEEEADYLGYLGRALEGSDVKIFAFDHCRERVYERAKLMMASENAHYLGGIANHWYSGDHFGELRALREVYPDLISIASEGCCAVTGEGIQPARELSFAEQYAHDICGCFNHGLHYYCDWNILLDEHNGPYHNRTGRGCSADAPMYAVAERDEVVYRLSYYYIGHYSKFVVPGASVVSSSSYDAGVESVAFKNPDGSVVCVLLNRTDAERRPILRLDGHIARLTLAPHSILTAVITR